jgi:hypothetical protein
VKPADELALLRDLHQDKLALVRRHQAGAARVPAYDENNAYQYVLAREDAHLDWLRRAITELGGVPADAEAAGELPVPAAGRGDESVQAVAEDDSRTAGEFLTRWRGRVAELPPGRNRKMLDLLLGEVSEHQRMFAQAARGRKDLLGRRPDGAGTGGGVLPVRWVE